jgi:uroporphyrinogen-III synthase
VKLLVLRPQPGADATVKRAEALGIEAVAMPLFVIESVLWQAPDPSHYDALMLTSANSLVHAGHGLEHLRALPVLAVGRATASQAEAAGFKVRVSGDSDVASLIGLAKEYGYRKLLWLTGANHIEVEPENTVKIDCVIVYRSVKIMPIDDIVALLRAPVITALHSPRAAKYFTEICNRNGIDKRQQSLVALSPAVAKAAGTGWRNLVIAEHPNDATMLCAVLRFFTNNPSDP